MESKINILCLFYYFNDDEPIPFEVKGGGRKWSD